LRLRGENRINRKDTETQRKIKLCDFAVRVKKEMKKP
jgi:hypothetical protein